MNRLSILDPTEHDIQLLLAAKCHLGTKNLTKDMEKYIWNRRDDGIFIIDIGKLWEKLILAARVIVGIKESQDIYVTSTSLRGRRPANKLSSFLNTLVNLGRLTPGTLTKLNLEPQLLVCLDPLDDYQAIIESSSCSIPVISFANTDSRLKFIDIAIPCNTSGSESIGVMCYLLARTVLRLKGELDYNQWHIIPDMFFYIAPEDRFISNNNEEEEQKDVKFKMIEEEYQDNINWDNDNPKTGFNQPFDDIILNDSIDWAEDTPIKTEQEWDNNPSWL